MCPSADRIDSSPYGKTFSSLAFENPDPSRVLIGLNEATVPQMLKIEDADDGFGNVVPPRSAATLIWTDRSKARHRAHRRGRR